MNEFHDLAPVSRATRSISRRGLLLGVAGVLATASSSRAFAQAEPGIDRPLRERVLLRGGTVLTLDPALGDLERGDVLIEGARIAAVAQRIEVSADTTDVIQAAGTVVMPGFIDTHRHMWQGALHNILPDGLLSDYSRDITGAARAAFQPEDARIGDLVSALGALNAGVTSILDWSHVGNSPAHSDAAIASCRSGRGRRRCSPGCFDSQGRAIALAADAAGFGRCVPGLRSAAGRGGFRAAE